MSKKIFRHCICCGKEYEYCSKCGKGEAPWRTLYDTEECREVMNIVSAYNMGRADANQVKAVLDKFNVTDYSKYKESINAVLTSLFYKVPVVESTPEETENTEDYYTKRKPWKKNYKNVDVDLEENSDEASN